MNKSISWPFVATIAVVWLPVAALFANGTMVFPPDLVRPALVATGGALAFVVGLVVKQPGWVEMFFPRPDAPPKPPPAVQHADGSFEDDVPDVPDTNPESPTAKRESLLP